MSETVLVTGAASGIGRACALEFARRDARLGLIDRDHVGLEATARSARALGASVTTFVVDLASPDAIDRLARDAEAQLGPIDIVFNNAGVAVVKPLERTTDDDWQWIFDVNVRAPIRLTRALLPAMIARGSGHIAMTASLAGLIGAPGMVAYSTTKFALVGFSEALRAELAPAGIGVTVVCPGYIPTGLHRATRYDNPVFERMLDAMPAWYGVSPERAARRIVDAIARRDPQLVLGIEKLGWYLKRLSPAVSFAVSRWIARRTGIVGARPPGSQAREARAGRGTS
jgi:NAD(P)-dependent dehydrogenase (short-subunit alcohol dehydrogenase family)